ncbi:putative secreted protein (Por secretion system target) [Dyadobacter jejuensis]|uniref:Putative secreted protein (Por secretion system target) n=1 Tax=Dyadobacter jejuensis TaxID=1082580 RepID=A0A316AYL9_9BACT|nr:T9SS type A sorting domain-containing protein [Dyadobacter jejuensis]PWJ55317.1 putative secreted protein (Por secretion system target) [Dyadobacter jejuensis]
MKNQYARLAYLLLVWTVFHADLMAQGSKTIEVGGACISSVISLTESAFSPIDGKPAYEGIGTVAGLSNIDVAIYWDNGEGKWLLTFSGQPFFYYDGNTMDPPNNLLGSWVSVSDGDCSTVTPLTIGGTGTQSDPLPVRLISFKATVRGSNVILSWSTAEEWGNAGFNILRSHDLVHWSSVGYVDGKGTSSTVHSYQFVDREALPQTSYYKLEQIDIDGSRDVSRIVTVSSKVLDLLLYPNPSHDFLEIMLPEGVEWISARIVNQLGQVVQRPIVARHIPVHSLPTGSYLLTLETISGQSISKRFTKH